MQEREGVDWKAEGCKYLLQFSNKADSPSRYLCDTMMSTDRALAKA